jgi:hypothetical protein
MIWEQLITRSTHMSYRLPLHLPQTVSRCLTEKGWLACMTRFVDCQSQISDTFQLAREVPRCQLYIYVSWYNCQAIWINASYLQSRSLYPPIQPGSCRYHPCTCLYHYTSGLNRDLQRQAGPCTQIIEQKQTSSPEAIAFSPQVPSDSVVAQFSRNDGMQQQLCTLLLTCDLFVIPPEVINYNTIQYNMIMRKGLNPPQAQAQPAIFGSWGLLWCDCTLPLSFSQRGQP